VQVTGYDGIRTKTYRVQFTVNLSTDASLADLQIDGQSVADFDPDTLRYSKMYPYEHALLPVVSATASQPDATIVCKQISQFPQTALITVYAGDTSIKRVYTVSLERHLGNNTYLSVVYLDSIPLGDFDKDVYHYDIELPYNAGEFPAHKAVGTLPNIWAASEDTTTIITVTQAEKITDTAYIEILSLNGSRKTYKFTFFEGLNTDATLAMIFIDGDSLPGFSPQSRNYPPLKLSSHAQGEVTAVTTDRNAVYEVIDTMSYYPKSVWVHVTAADNLTLLVYRVRLDKDANSIRHIAATEKVTVYPNPISDKLTVTIDHQLGKTYQLLICNELGTNVGTYLLQDVQNSIVLSHLLSGIYYYRIIIDNQIIASGKLIKQ
jgi:hypothetical protein